MMEGFPTRLLLRLLHGTPEELALVQRLLDAELWPGAQQNLAPDSGLPLPQIADRAGVAAAAGAYELPEVSSVKTMFNEILRRISAVARRDHELIKENDELRRLKAGGLFDFSARIAPLDFQVFAAIMAVGNANAAAKVLKMPSRTVYDRLAKWSERGKDYLPLLRWSEWRKAVGRKIKLRLEDSVQSGEPNDTPENPETISEVIDTITAADNRDYPAILLQIMETLKAQNTKNWAAVRGELVEMIQQEVPQ
jgi:hypothetical protein